MSSRKWDDTVVGNLGRDRHGPLWKHFRHLGRVQENYTDALKTGKVQFSTKAAHYDGGPSSKSLLVYLKALDQSFRRELELADPAKTINWFGESVTIDQHLIRLAEHEILHHGQFVVCLKLLKRDFPPSWAVWGLA